MLCVPIEVILKAPSFMSQLPIKLIIKKDQSLAYSPAWLSVADAIFYAILAFGGREWRRSRHAHERPSDGLRFCDRWSFGWKCLFGWLFPLIACFIGSRCRMMADLSFRLIGLRMEGRFGQEFLGRVLGFRDQRIFRIASLTFIFGWWIMPLHLNESYPPDLGNKVWNPELSSFRFDPWIFLSINLYLNQKEFSFSIFHTNTRRMLQEVTNHAIPSVFPHLHLQL